MNCKFLGFSIAFFCTALMQLSAADSPKLLIKVQTHGDADHLIKTIENYHQNLSQELPFQIIMSTDLEEPTINSTEFTARLKAFPNVTVMSSAGKSKVEAYNQGIKDNIKQFDIVIVSSDQLTPFEKNYDKTISDLFTKEFPDGDGVLNFVNYGNESINEVPVIGKKYFQRFGYIYNPEYQNSAYDRELTFTSRILGKEFLHNQEIYKKIPSAEESTTDAITHDETVFQKRRLNNFDLDEAMLQKMFPKDWSILICTLDERSEPFTFIYNKLHKQIVDNHLEDKVEILFFKDNRENTVGFKRNSLLKESRGSYTNFIDDDDDIHENYVAMIHEKLKNKPDCVSLVGIITFNDQHPTKFIHSVKFNKYFQANGIYFRPPNHLNPMKRSTAIQFLFPAISYGEDTDWAMRISNAKLLHKEEEITIPYYFYKFVADKSVKKEAA